MSKKAEGFSLRFVLINTGNISRKVLSKVLRSFDKNFERLHAERVPSEDVKSFVTVFVTAKKSGGDMIGIIRNTTSQIGDKIEVKREIDTLLAAKKYEFQIMSMVPYGIIAYMSLSFSDFMEELYGNVTGIGVMTLCLGIYVGAYYLGVRFLRIDV